MIYPLHRYTLKGFLWYQGESNKDAALYQQLLPKMVDAWRHLFGNLPFYYVQIAPYNYKDRNTAYLREAQLRAHIRNSGMVVSLDAGVINRIHPPDKTTLSERLAALALAHTYGMKGFVYKSPRCKTLRYKDGVALLRFDQPLREGTITGFEVAGDDQVFYNATAVVVGNTVHVSSLQVQKPVAVRYAFRNWVIPTLFSVDELPASSFLLHKVLH